MEINIVCFTRQMHMTLLNVRCSLGRLNGCVQARKLLHLSEISLLISLITKTKRLKRKVTSLHQSLRKSLMTKLRVISVKTELLTLMLNSQKLQSSRNHLLLRVPPPLVRKNDLTLCQRLEWEKVRKSNSNI
jgi:hypothetical protein